MDAGNTYKGKIGRLQIRKSIREGSLHSMFYLNFILMKKLGKLKLNDWAEAQLSNSELRQLKGGAFDRGCFLGCAAPEKVSQDELDNEYALHTSVVTVPSIPPSPIPVSTPPLELITLPKTT